jgi:uncharacterized protein DUF3435
MYVGKVSEALQNLMMGHGDARTFLRHYLHRRVTADTAAIVRGLDPQESIMRSACTMSRWIDPDRPWGLTEEQASSVNNDIIIQSLFQQRIKLKQRFGAKATMHQEYKKLEKRIRSEKQRLRDILLADIQERYEREGPVRVIERQLSGIKIDKQPKVMSYFSENTLPEQRRLIEAIMLAPPGATLDEEVKRRNNAINAVTAYCKIEEGRTPKRVRSSLRQAKAGAIKQEKDMQSPQDRALEAAMLSVFKEKRPTICFLCLGNDTAPFNDRIYSFNKPGDLSRHFRRRHLSIAQKGGPVECKVCIMPLDGVMHLQRHAIEIHGTVS